MKIKTDFPWTVAKNDKKMKILPGTLRRMKKKIRSPLDIPKDDKKWRFPQDHYEGRQKIKISLAQFRKMKQLRSPWNIPKDDKKLRSQLDRYEGWQKLKISTGPVRRMKKISPGPFWRITKIMIYPGPFRKMTKIKICSGPLPIMKKN